jgi:hypothetical protein
VSLAAYDASFLNVGPLVNICILNGGRLPRQRARDYPR